MGESEESFRFSRRSFISFSTWPMLLSSPKNTIKSWKKFEGATRYRREKSSINIRIRYPQWKLSQKVFLLSIRHYSRRHIRRHAPKNEKNRPTFCFFSLISYSVTIPRRPSAVCRHCTDTKEFNWVSKPYRTQWKPIDFPRATNDTRI